MLKSRGMVFVFMVLLAAGAYAADRANFQDGLWEISTTTQMDMPGMPKGMGANSMTAKQCLKSDNPVPANADKTVKCKNQKVDISGNTVNWRTTCTTSDGTKVDMNGKLTYSGRTSFAGTQDMKMSGGDSGPMNMHSTTNGHYIGPCPANK